MEPKLTIEEAKEKNLCRLCGKDLVTSASAKKWDHTYRYVTNGIPVILNFGKEHSHESCVQERRAEIVNRLNSGSGY